MSILPLRPVAPLPAPPAPRPAPVPPPPNGREVLLDGMVSLGAVSRTERSRAEHLARQLGVSPVTVLVAEGWLDPGDLFQARCSIFGLVPVTLSRTPAEPELALRAGLEWCLQNGVLPWRSMSGATVLITAAPEEFAHIRSELPASFGTPILSVAPLGDIHEALRRAHGPRMVTQAETALSAPLSCRAMRSPDPIIWLLTMACVASLITLAPLAVLSAVIWITLGTLAVTMFYKTVLACACLAPQRERDPPIPSRQTADLPRITILVPLLRESEVAAKLLNNLDQLRYPRALLEVVFVTEADDDVTKNALSQLVLPRSFRTLEVPPGTVKTKPRALNFALPFCRGTVIGIYDAEDRPDRDQLLKVAEAFRHAPPEVACMQGRLDFFNNRFNLIARSFTAEYAGWFGLFLQGLDRLKLPIPLGGTTLFIRRDVIEDVGPWDAHNVTEDADLGLRLYRRGYRVELIDTVTQEEANFRAWPWIKQRSRWIKGYMVTYGVHMRRPLRLWRELGAAGFASVQCLFLGSILSALTMPVLWMLWGATLFAPPEALAMLSIPTGRGLGTTMLGIEAVNLTLWALGVRLPRHRYLLPMLPLLHLYFLMSSVAALKALVELIHRPFYWDKTEHGVVVEDA